MPAWAQLTFTVCDAAWLLLGLGSVGLAAVVALRRGALERLETFLEPSFNGTGRAATLAVLAGLPLLFGVYNCARHAVFQLTADSGIMGNLAWNVIHGYGLKTAVLGDRSYLGVHFAFAIGALAPLLLVWNSISALAFAQGVLVGSAPAALFLIARRRSRDAVVPWLVYLLALAHPSYQELVGTVLDNSVLAFLFFLWAAYFFEAKRWILGALMAALMLSTREQAPFMTAGVGLLIAAAGSTKRRRICGLALLLGSALLWLVEMKLIGSVRSKWPCFDNWGYFNAIGGTPEAILTTALTRPWRLLAALVEPPAKIIPVLRVMAFAGFLPLLSGPFILPALTSWAPHQLANYGTHYQALRGHYPSFVLGPLLFSSLYGLLRLRKALPQGRWHQAVALCSLVAACGFFSASRFYYPEARVVPAAWFEAAPQALERIPPEASVWVDGYLLPNLAMRRHVKTLPMTLPDCSFEEGLFLPDYVLLTVYWTRLVPPAVHERVLGFLKDRGFEVAFRDADLVLLRNPGPRSAEPERVSLPSTPLPSAHR